LTEKTANARKRECLSVKNFTPIGDRNLPVRESEATTTPARKKEKRTLSQVLSLLV